LDDISIVGAKGILINITGGDDMTLYDVSDATQTVYDAVGEDTETNIIFGAVTDSTMNGKIRVTVIATGFNEESMDKNRDSTAQRMMVKLPGQKKDAVEQLSIALNVPPKQSNSELESEDRDKAAQDNPATQKEKQGIPVVNNAGASIECLPFIKKEAIRKERVYVSKGSVITQYEDDMEVPTFLRKQMQ
jgi:cell division protein FtsZ